MMPCHGESDDAQVQLDPAAADMFDLTSFYFIYIYLTLRKKFRIKSFFFFFVIVQRVHRFPPVLDKDRGRPKVWTHKS